MNQQPLKKNKQKKGSVRLVKRLDHEARLEEHDHHSIKLWLRMLTCSSLIEGSVRNSLRTNFDTTLPRFDFMAQLQRAPQGITMGELSNRMMVSGGNVSGIASQLVNEGLVERTPLPEDRRTFVVKLSEKGAEVFEQMANEHEQWVIRLLGGLNQQDVDQLYELLGKVKATVSTAIEADT